MVYAGAFGVVVDLTDDLHDPVDLLFGTQLGGGTDINRALAFCQGTIARPAQTILVLISDLYDDGNASEMLRHAASLVGSGIQVIGLLALSDRGAPAYHREHASVLAQMGIPVFACTSDLFPELMASAVNRQDLALWAVQQHLVVAPSA